MATQYDYENSPEYQRLWNLVEEAIQDKRKEMMTFKEACEYTGFEPSYMYKLTSQHKIPHSKPTGGKIFFNRKEIVQWLRQNKNETVDLEAMAIATKLAKR